MKSTGPNRPGILLKKEEVRETVEEWQAYMIVKTQKSSDHGGNKQGQREQELQSNLNCFRSRMKCKMHE